MIFLLLLGIVIVFYIISQKKKKNRSLEDLKQLDFGSHNFHMMLSKPQSDNIESIKRGIEDSKNVLKGLGLKHFRYDEAVLAIRFFRPEKDRAIYVYSDMSADLKRAHGFKNHGLLGFINFEYYKWFEALKFEDNHEFSNYFIDPIKLNPFKKSIEFTVIKMEPSLNYFKIKAYELRSQRKKMISEPSNLYGEYELEFLGTCTGTSNYFADKPINIDRHLEFPKKESFLRKSEISINLVCGSQKFENSGYLNPKIIAAVFAKVQIGVALISHKTKNILDEFNWHCYLLKVTVTPS